MAITIPHIGAGAQIPSSWLNQVADTVTAHDAYLSVALAAMIHTTVITSCANGSVLTSTFDTVDYDPGGLVNLPLHNDRITLNATGLFVLAGYIGWPFNATGTRGTLLYVNGVEQGAQRGPGSPTSGSGTTQTVMFPYRCTVTGDYVQLVKYQTSGGALNDGSTGYTCRLAVFRVGL